jgi:hypothetical protein
MCCFAPHAVGAAESVTKPLEHTHALRAALTARGQAHSAQVVLVLPLPSTLLNLLPSQGVQAGLVALKAAPSGQTARRQCVWT